VKLIQLFVNMTERRNTIVCAFESNAPRLSAFDVHEWISEMLTIPEEEVLVIQIDGPQRKVFIKLTDRAAVTKVSQQCADTVECKHATGEITRVKISEAGMGFRRIRVANLPPEDDDAVLRAALAPYGKVMEVVEEAWSRAYKYKVGSGVRYVTMTLTKHAPSNLIIKGTRVFLTYERQPLTCFRCGEVGHMYSVCPHRRPARRPFAVDTPPHLCGSNGPNGRTDPSDSTPLSQTEMDPTVEERRKVDRWSEDMEPEQFVSASTGPTPRGTGKRLFQRRVDRTRSCRHPCLVGGGRARSPGSSRGGEATAADTGTSKLKPARSVEDTQHLTKRQKKMSKPDKLPLQNKEASAMATRGATTKSGGSQ
jgi:hypothetical protein